MNENEDYTHVQRRLCAVMAKSEWTSSRMRMQKSGEELRERRAKSHRSANEFLQDLFDKRTDGDLIDDNGVVDRYNKFRRYKSVLNDDSNSSLGEFDRRLGALNNNRRNQTTKLNNQKLNTNIKRHQQQFTNDSQSTIEVENDKNDIIQVHNEDRPKPSRKLPSISANPITSTPNDTASELTTSITQDDGIQELSSVKSASISFIDSQANHLDSSISQHHSSSSSSLDKTETLYSSTPSLNHLLSSTLHAPKACRPDGTEIIVSSSISPLPHDSSNVLLFNHCYFPRSLTSRGKINTTSVLKRQLPSLPSVQPIEQKQSQHEQFDTNQLYDFLDHLDNKSDQSSYTDFTKMLDQLSLSTVTHHNQDKISHSLSAENLSLNNDNDNPEEHIFPNLFDQSSSLTHDKLFYTTLTITIDDPKNIFLYTMTLSTVQLSASMLLPYSILNGRRPLLKSSKQTLFKQIRSKQQKYTCQVIAIESSVNIKQLQQNDIILKINDQSVWGSTIDAVSDILKKSSKQANNCSLTIARLCQPFV